MLKYVSPLVLHVSATPGTPCPPPKKCGWVVGLTGLPASLEGTWCRVKNLPPPTHLSLCWEWGVAPLCGATDDREGSVLYYTSVWRRQNETSAKELYLSSCVVSANASLSLLPSFSMLCFHFFSQSPEKQVNWLNQKAAGRGASSVCSSNRYNIVLARWGRRTTLHDTWPQPCSLKMRMETPPL